MTPKLRSRRGFALPVAIGAIVLIGTMLSGIFFLVTQEARISKNTATQEVAFRAAERGINNVLATWNKDLFSSLTTGTPVTLSTVDGVTYTYDSTGRSGPADTVTVTKLSSYMYLVVSTGRGGVSGLQATIGARKRSSLVVKLVVPTFNFLGALTVRGALQVGGSSNINGTDQNPTGWGCATTTTIMPGIATNNGSNVSFSGCNNLTCVQGSPKIDTTAAAGDSTTYFSFGDASWASLVALANITITGGPTLNGIGPIVSNGSCMKAQATPDKNWGDPNRANPRGPCESYFPIIYVSNPSANTSITGGTGQGILLVDGDLTVDGGFTFYGPVIVRGHLRTQGTGGHFNGGVMAANVDLEQNAVLGNAIINYSSCAISQAILGASGGTAMTQRAWSEVF